MFDVDSTQLLYVLLACFFFVLCFGGWLYKDFPQAKAWCDKYVVWVDSLLE